MAILNFPTTDQSPFEAPNGVTYEWDGQKWVAQGSGASPHLESFRNQIINGDFRVWQRGTDITNQGAQLYTADRWKEKTNFDTQTNRKNQQDKNTYLVPYHHQLVLNHTIMAA